MTVAGQGAHSDIVMASALALVNALNRLKARKLHRSSATTEFRKAASGGSNPPEAWAKHYT